MNDILNKVITITSVETKLTTTGKTMLKLTDHENKHYQIWKTKADGTDSVAYQRLQDLGEPVGKVVEIGYKEDAGDYQGKAITYKTIINIKLTNGNPNRSETMVKAQMAEASKKTTDEKWKEISRGKVRHGVACEFIRLGEDLTPALVNKINRWTDFIMTGQLLVEPKLSEELGEELTVENFPF